MPPFARLAIPPSILDEAIVHACAELPNECCGLLAGTITDGIGTVTARYAVGNDVASPREFATNPRDLLTSFRLMRDCGFELLAIYHSHPASAPVPSRRDLERNTYGDSVVHVIVSLAGSSPEVRGWWLGNGEFEEAEIRG